MSLILRCQKGIIDMIVQHQIPETPAEQLELFSAGEYQAKDLSEADYLRRALRDRWWTQRIGESQSYDTQAEV